MSWKNGRPDGWKNPHLKHHYSSISPTECKCWYCTEWRAYEAGADAYAKGIWKMAEESPTGTFTFDTNTVNIFGGKE